MWQERFISRLIKIHGKHNISTNDGGTWYPPQACKFLKIDHHLHSPFEKSIIRENYAIHKRIGPKALMTIFHVEIKSVN